MSDQLDLLDPRARWERLEIISLERLRLFQGPDDEPYILAYSGGKDSDVILSLARAAGVRYEAHYHATTIDPPEVVRHVLAQPDVVMDRPARSMAQLIRAKGLPSRFRRWCCAELKERAYPGRTVVTGVRWAESARRRTRSMAEAARQGHGQRFLHPIIDWEEADVWGYLRARGVKTCTLYAEGQTRVGCVCCPMAPRRQAASAARWPGIAGALRRAWLDYAARHPKEGRDDERFWSTWIAGEVGDSTRDDQGCPLWADARDGDEVDQ